MKAPPRRRRAARAAGLRLPALLLPVLLLGFTAGAPEGVAEPGGSPVEWSQAGAPQEEPGTGELPPEPISEQEYLFAFMVHDPDGEMADGRVEAARERLSRRAVELRGLLPLEGAPRSLIRVHLYPSVEAKALASGDMAAAHAIPEVRELHLSLQPGLEGDRLALEAGLLLREAWGAPGATAVEEGVIVLLSEDWMGAEYRDWAGRLHRADLLPGLEELLDDEAFHAASRPIHRVAAAALVEWLLMESSPGPVAEGAPSLPQRLPELARHWRLGADGAAALEPRWMRHLDSLATHGDALSRASVEGPFQRGFNFAHEGYRIHNGFGSRSAAQALERLEDLGTNAVAVLPYTFLSDAGQPGPFRIPTRPGAENDEAVIHAILSAQERGMEVMLKPQIWLRGSWPGEIRMEREAEWDRFFRGYARWIGHYAVLAQVHGVAAFCMGTELSAAALERPDDWRRLAHRLRQVYGGRLGYCANWGEEVESVAFWDAVDFIGVSFYYPLSRLPRPSQRSLREAAGQALDDLEALGRRHQRPVILAEVGFASSPRAWQRPWEEERGPGARVDLEAQVRGYRAVIEALEGREGIRGVYWWKWPTTAPGDPLTHPGFTPAGKPAERLVAEWFQREAQEGRGKGGGGGR